jgi:hypothetical protein
MLSDGVLNPTIASGSPWAGAVVNIMAAASGMMNRCMAPCLHRFLYMPEVQETEHVIAARLP